VFSPDHDEVAYREALKKIEKAISLESDNIIFIHSLAAVQYRLGAYEDTLAAVAHAEKIRDDANIGPNRGPVSDVLRAMALHGLGREKEANAVIQQLRCNYKERWFSIDNADAPFFLRIIIEVEMLFADGDSTLLSVWELIEQYELDEAAEVIEKIRLSNDAEAIDRMQGAIKLLEILRNLK